MKNEKEYMPLLPSKVDTVTYEIDEEEHSKEKKEEKSLEMNNNTYFKEEIINCALVNGLSSFFMLSPVDIGGLNYMF